MCGFFAAIGEALCEDELREAAKRISHRGPDGCGEINEKYFYGIHYRLSIIDLHERSLQPFIEKECVLLFNGEIYNYKSLKSYLSSKYDIDWRTTGDTEVLFHGLFYEGKDFVNRINGIFAFVYYNFATKSYLAARDRLGVKPLYQRSNSSSIEFCSEVKGFQNYADRLNHEAINEYLSYQFYLDGKTPFSGITEVKPATVIVGCPGKQELYNYWDEK